MLTEHDLKESKPDDDVQLLARAQTLMVVGRLDARRKSDLVRFLYGAGLIAKDSTIVDLGGANLRGASLYHANLDGANLRGADLGDADLRDADLRDADLGGATGKTYEELE